MMVEEGVRILAVLDQGSKRVTLNIKGLPFNIWDKEILTLGKCLDSVNEKGVRYKEGLAGMMTSERYMEIEQKKDLTVPVKPKMCGNCLLAAKDCPADCFEQKCG